MRYSGTPNPCAAVSSCRLVFQSNAAPRPADSAGRGAALDWKTSLQELTAAQGLGVPEYRIEGTGPDHLKTFTAWVVVAGQRYGGAEGRSKKEAEQRAAEAAWRTLTEQAGQEPAEAGSRAAGGA